MSAFLVCDGWCSLVGVDKEHDPPYLPVATNPNAAYAAGWEPMVHASAVPSIARQVLLNAHPAEEAWCDFCPACQERAKAEGYVTGSSEVIRKLKAWWLFAVVFTSFWPLHMFFRWMEGGWP